MVRIPLNNQHLNGIVQTFIQFMSKKIDFISKSDQNRDCRFRLVVGFGIGPKSTIEIDWLGIRIVNNSIPKP